MHGNLYQTTILHVRNFYNNKSKMTCCCYGIPYFWKCGKDVRKNRKCWLLVLSPFPTMFYLFCILGQSTVKGKGLRSKPTLCLGFFRIILKYNYPMKDTFLIHSQTSPGFYVSAVQVFWKHCGKRRNCSWRAISPFPTVFSTHLENFLPFSSNLKLSSANSFSLEESKLHRLGKG